MDKYGFIKQYVTTEPPKGTIKRGRGARLRLDLEVMPRKPAGRVTRALQTLGLTAI